MIPRAQLPLLPCDETQPKAKLSAHRTLLALAGDILEALAQVRDKDYSYPKFGDENIRVSSATAALTTVLMRLSSLVRGAHEPYLRAAILSAIGILVEWLYRLDAESKND